MQEMLQEYVDSRGASVCVDRAAGVIHGVKILGLESRNGRSYLPEALAQAAPLYEGAKVNVNHPKGSPLGPRDYQDRIGVIRNAAVRPGEGLFGELHFNPKHALAEQLAWDAEHAPENVGLSHNVEARTRRSGERVAVEAILRVHSVDLVADPATTRGLFEAAEGTPEAAARAGGTAQPGPLEALTLEELQRQRPDLVEAICQESMAGLSRLRSEVARHEASESVRRKQLRVRELLREFRLPDPDRAEGPERALVSERFVETLLEAPDDQAMRRLVEDRAALARSLRESTPQEGHRPLRPLSRDQLHLDGRTPTDAKAFAEAIL